MALMVIGLYAFVFVDALARGTGSPAACAGLALWVAPVVASLAALPMLMSRVVTHNSRRDYLRW